MDIEQSHDSAKPSKSYLSKADVMPRKIYFARMHIHIVDIGKAKFGEVTCIIIIATFCDVRTCIHKKIILTLVLASDMNNGWWRSRKS